MSKNNVEEQKKDNNYLKVIFSVLIMVVGVLAELYIMIILNGRPIYLCVFGVIILITTYILINSIIQIKYRQMKVEREEYDNLYRSEKASYLIIRKSFDEIFQRLESLERSIKLPTDELITAQKAIAKVNISRNKENTDALMNSNDKMLEKIFEFEDLLDKSNKKLLESQNLIIEQQMKDVMLKQQEINATIKEMQLSLKNEILQEINAVKIEDEKETSAIGEPVIEEEPLIEEPVIEQEQEEVTSPMPDLSDPNKLMSPDEIAALIANM